MGGMAARERSGWLATVRGRCVLKSGEEDPLARRPCCKRVEEMPGVNYFKPRGRAAGRPGGGSPVGRGTGSSPPGPQGRASTSRRPPERMGVSRATFGRVAGCSPSEGDQSPRGRVRPPDRGRSLPGSVPEACERCPPPAGQPRPGRGSLRGMPGPHPAGFRGPGCGPEGFPDGDPADS